MALFYLEGWHVVAEANRRALRAGYAFGETTEIFHTHYRVKPAQLPPGTALQSVIDLAMMFNSYTSAMRLPLDPQYRRVLEPV